MCPYLLLQSIGLGLELTTRMGLLFVSEPRSAHLECAIRLFADDVRSVGRILFRRRKTAPDADELGQ